MLNNNKVRLMTRLAMYEKREGKEDIRLSKYYKTDYVRLNILKTVVSVTVGYLLVLLMIGIYHMEYLISEAVNLNYKDMGLKILGGYLAILTVYISSSLVGYTIYYNRSRKKLSKYFKMLKKLSRMYQEEERAADRED
ncbi:MAG: hypothetical protein J6B85_02845 [Lachnospiraceae bacterium]|nr:hypothetical protein [Lachnospiraceae bacterium]